MCSCLVDFADGDSGSERGRALVRAEPAQQNRQQRRLAGAVGPGDQNAITPVDLRRDRSEREPGSPDECSAQHRHDGSATGSRGDLHPQFPLLAGLFHHLEAFDTALCLTSFRGLFLGRFGARLAGDLVVVGGLASRIAYPRLHPVPLHLCP